MPTFNIQSNDEELGGPAAELADRVVAWLPLSEYKQTKDFEDGEGPKTSTVLRTRAYTQKDGKLEDRGIRLIFWDAPRTAIKTGVITADLHIGVLTKEQHYADPTRSFWNMVQPDAAKAAELIAAFANTTLPERTTLVSTADAADEAPF